MIKDFDQLFEELSDLPFEERYDYADQFFTNSNYYEYIKELHGNKKREESLKLLFDCRQELFEKVDRILGSDVLCAEAYLIAIFIMPDLDISNYFRAFLDERIRYEELDTFDQDSYLRILNMLVAYLIDLHNYSFSLQVLDMIDKYVTPDLSSLIRRGYCLMKLERADDFYDLFIQSNFRDPLFCIHLLITLLKANDEKRAKEVYLAMLETYPSIIDLVQPWENEDDPVLAVFMDALDAAGDDLLSVPYFFDFLASCTQKPNYS